MFCQAHSGSFSLDDVYLPPNNPCKTGIFIRKWMEALREFLNKYQFKGRYLIAYTKYHAFWEGLENASNYPPPP